MTTTVWVSLGLCVLFFLVIAGLPLWFIFRHKEWGPHHHDGTSVPGPTPQRAEVPVQVAEARRRPRRPGQVEVLPRRGRPAG